MRLIDDFYLWMRTALFPPDFLHEWKAWTPIDFEPLITSGMLQHEDPPRFDIPAKLPFSVVALYGNISPINGHPQRVLISLEEIRIRERNAVSFVTFYQPSPHRWECVSKFAINCDDSWFPESPPAGKVPVYDPLTLSPFVAKHPDKEFREWCIDTSLIAHRTALKVIQLLNCKNIVLEAHDPMLDFKSSIRRHWEKKGREPLVKHYTLSVRVPSRVMSSPSGPAGTLKNTMPLHTCRGHFSTYGEEAKLFGKYTGTFWVPAHVRGTLKNGEIVKDYKLKPGATA